jgi:hypothetical protein
MHADKIALAHAYLDLIGYDPFQEDPSATACDVAQIMVDYLRERYIDPVKETFDALAAEYQTYLRAHGLPDEDAESLILDDAIRAQHGRYLSQFIARWEAVTA